MESTFADNRDAGRGEARAREANSNLIADVQDLLGRVAHVADPEIARLRTNVERRLMAAKKALVDGTDRVQRHARSAMSAETATFETSHGKPLELPPLRACWWVFWPLGASVASNRLVGLLSFLAAEGEL